MDWFEAIGFVLVGSKYKNVPPEACITVSESVIIIADKLNGKEKKSKFLCNC